MARCISVACLPSSFVLSNTKSKASWTTIHKRGTKSIAGGSYKKATAGLFNILLSGMDLSVDTTSWLTLHFAWTRCTSQIWCPEYSLVIAAWVSLINSLLFNYVWLINCIIEGLERWTELISRLGVSTNMLILLATTFFCLFLTKIIPC